MDRIFVRDRAGAGMDNRALHDWLHWGGGPTHLEDDIGQFHVGGKLAAMYLAPHSRSLCRAADTGRTVWYFSDPAWGTRTEFADSSISELPESSPESWLGQMQDNNQGFVQITLGWPQAPHIDDIDALRERITDTYQPLLERIVNVQSASTIANLKQTLLPWMSKPMVRNLPVPESRTSYSSKGGSARSRTR